MPAAGRRGGLAVAERSQSSSPVDSAPVQARDTGSPQRERAKLTITLVGLLLYVFVITSNRVPVGEASIIIAAGGLLINPTSFQLPAYLKWLLAFAVWVTIASTQTAYPGVVAESITTLWKLIIIVFIATNALRTRAQVRLFMVFFLACFMLFPVRGALSNYFVYHNDVQGRAIWNFVYSNPNDLAAMCILQLSMALTIVVAEPKGWVRRAAYLSILLLVFLLLLTQSRGAFLGLVVFVAALIAGQRRRLLLMVRLAVVAAVVVSLAPASVWNRLGTLRNATKVETLDEVDGEGGSARQRYEIWRVAAKIIQDHPVYGVGLGAYKNNHLVYSLQSEFNPTAQGGRDTHSLYLNVLAETGYLGLLLYMGMLTGIFLAAERTRRKCKRVLAAASRQFLFLEAGLVAFLTAAIFGSLPYLPHLLLHLVLLQVLARLYRTEAETQIEVRARAPERFVGGWAPAGIA